MDLVENNRNISYKTLSAYQWLWQKQKTSTHFHVDWIIKSDDDISVNWPEFLARLDASEAQILEKTDNALVCHYVLHNRFPIRNPYDKL